MNYKSGGIWEDDVVAYLMYYFVISLMEMRKLQKISGWSYAPDFWIGYLLNGGQVASRYLRNVKSEDREADALTNRFHAKTVRYSYRTQVWKGSI
jgi:hypothetical protein